MKELLLAGAAILFIVFMLFRLIRALIVSRSLCVHTDANGCAVPDELKALVESAATPTRARELLREIEHRASGKNAVERACYYYISAEIARTVLKRQGAAVHFYIRALRNDPACEPALDRLVSVLLAQKNYRLLERTCWSLLSRMNEDATGTSVWVRCWTALGSLYAVNPRLVDRSDAIRKMLNTVSTDAEDEMNDDLPATPV